MTVLKLHVTWNNTMWHVKRWEINMATLVNDRVKKHRDALRRSGLRPVQIWLPDTRQAGFAAECRRQSQLIAKAESTDQDVFTMLDQALNDIAGWE